MHRVLCASNSGENPLPLRRRLWASTGAAGSETRPNPSLLRPIPARFLRNPAPGLRARSSDPPSSTLHRTSRSLAQKMYASRRCLNQIKYVGRAISLAPVPVDDIAKAVLHLGDTAVIVQARGVGLMRCRRGASFDLHRSSTAPCRSSCGAECRPPAADTQASAEMSKRQGDGAGATRVVKSLSVSRAHGKVIESRTNCPRGSEGRQAPRSRQSRRAAAKRRQPPHAHLRIQPPATRRVVRRPPAGAHDEGGRARAGASAAWDL